MPIKSEVINIFQKALRQNAEDSCLYLMSQIGQNLTISFERGHSVVGCGLRELVHTMNMGITATFFEPLVFVLL